MNELNIMLLINDTNNSKQIFYQNFILPSVLFLFFVVVYFISLTISNRFIRLTF